MRDSVTNTLLLGPGPSTVSEHVRRALALPTIGHLDPRLIAIMDDVKRMLRSLFETQNSLTMPLSGTGSAGMEASFVNFVEPGDRVLVFTNGVFGRRMQDVASRLGAAVTPVEFEWGTPVDLDVARRELGASRYDLVAVVHAETSTGVRNPVSELAPLVAESGALY
ncbi:MAG: pyridoxal-phosphate-dependent aminotransferase family protein, partial [Spirochaetota bacterium]